MTAWQHEALRDLGTWSGGGTPSKGNPKYWQDGSVPWLSPKDMGPEVLTGTKDHITDVAVAGSSTKLVAPNSVAVVARSGILERTLPVAVVPFATTLNQDMKALTCRPGIDPRWVAWGLRAHERELLRAARKAGTTVASLEWPRFLDWSLPIPPLAEQRRIIEILEDHLSRLDAANDYLDAAEVRAAGLIDAVLAGAPELKGCPDVSLSAVLAAPLANGRSVPTRAGGFPVLRLTALRDEDVDLSERKAGAWNAADAERFLVQRGDVFVSRGNGSLYLVGRAAAVREDPDPVAFPDTMIRIRPNNAVIDSDYLVVVWNSRGTRQQIERTARTTAGIYKVNQRDLEAIHLPLPALPQQEAIRTRVAELRAITLVAVGAVDRARQRSAQLRQALLAAAFAGRLTGHSSDLDLAEEMALA